MYFDKNFYLSYIRKKEFINGIVYVILIISAIIIGYSLNVNLKITPGIAYTIPVLIATFIDYIIYLKQQIQLEEMKMKLDIYNKIMQENNEE